MCGSTYRTRNSDWWAVRVQAFELAEQRIDGLVTHREGKAISCSIWKLLPLVMADLFGLETTKSLASARRLGSLPSVVAGGVHVRPCDSGRIGGRVGLVALQALPWPKVFSYTHLVCAVLFVL